MNQNRWAVYTKRADFKAIGEKFGIDQVTARIIRNRDIVGDEQVRRYLHGTMKDLTAPDLLGGAARASALLLEKIRKEKRIRIIGDYDIDGVCSTCILYLELKKQGAQVDYEIPDRIRDGYGLHASLIEKAHEDGIDTILTCDNGITAIEEITLAKEMGMTVIVTDHHQCSFEETEEQSRIYRYPPADVLVDPHIPDDPYPEKDICGAVVSWKVMQLLRAMAEGISETRPHPAAGTLQELCMEYLEFAAIATVGDVMDLRGENRIIVREGLKALSNTQNIGLQALIRHTQLEGRQLSAYHIGFILGPCINASGRLDTARKALRLLLSSSRDEAEAVAGELVSLNEQRKEMTKQSVDTARRMIENGIEETETAGLPVQSDKKSSSSGKSSQTMDKVIVLYLPGCHESIAGIVAGKVREIYNHPALILTDAQEEGMLKGSGRSVEAYSMFDGLQQCSRYLQRFGGHPMAAGLTLRKEDLSAFRTAINENCTLEEEDFSNKLMIDAPMPLAYLRTDLIREFECLEPCGKGNEKPVFAQKGLEIVSMWIIGKNKNVLKMGLRDESSHTTEGLYFGDIQQALGYLEEKSSPAAVSNLLRGRYMSADPLYADILYYPQINTYRGIEEIQVIIKDIK